MKQLTGWHVFAMFGLGFGIIIAVNMTLAINAVRSFPGLEVKNSYVASQAFEQNKTAQQALNWDVSAALENDQLILQFTENGQPVKPRIVSAVFGRATSVVDDQNPDFRYDQGVFVARVNAAPGNWNLRIVALADDETQFQQRIVVKAQK